MQASGRSVEKDRERTRWVCWRKCRQSRSEAFLPPLPLCQQFGSHPEPSLPEVARSICYLVFFS